MLTRKERCYAIMKSVYFGLLPSWFYEKECHYKKDGECIGGYFGHLWINVLVVKSLLMKTEHESTHGFHKLKIKKWTRWHYD